MAVAHGEPGSLALRSAVAHPRSSAAAAGYRPPQYNDPHGYPNCDPDGDPGGDPSGGRGLAGLPPRPRYLVAASVSRSIPVAYRRKPADPPCRPLRVLTSDPTASRLEGSIASIDVPYEPLGPGPAGSLFKVDGYDHAQCLQYKRADLDDAAVLLQDGYDPSPANPRFHQQMVYAVCSSVHASFRDALGRQPSWGFKRRGEDRRLYLRPFAFEGENAYYDKLNGCISFGYCRMPATTRAARAMPGETVFTCLSHDVVAHEVTHALLDGLRSNFSVPTGPDVPGFHEGFCDLVAIFQRMTHREVVAVAIRKSHGMLDETSLLAVLGRQLGLASGREHVRDPLTDRSSRSYDPDADAHEIGNVLAGAVLDAYLTVFQRKTARFRRLASAGSGIIPPGDLSHDLAEVLTTAARNLARQFLTLVIRAVDYCPPVDIHLGEYLRALVTADHDLVPDDPWAYREALVDAFIKRHINPQEVTARSEHALLWRGPRRSLPAMTELDFAHLRFGSDPGCPADAAELERQARVLGEFATRPGHLQEFGLTAHGAPELEGAVAELPQVTSIRASRRIGPDREIVFDLVAEITQRCMVPPRGGKPGYPLFGGATVIVGPDGAIRYVISKSAVGKNRLARRLAFMASRAGSLYWTVEHNLYRMRSPMFQVLHQ